MIASPPNRPITSHADAAERLPDAEYFAWAQAEARKLFEALIARRWPELSPRRPSQRTFTPSCATITTK